MLKTEHKCLQTIHGYFKIELREDWSAVLLNVLLYTIYNLLEHYCQPNYWIWMF